MEAGQPYELFWRLTWKELLLILEAEGRRLHRQDTDRAWLAWHIEALSRWEKLPALKDLVPRRTAAGAAKKPDWRQDFAAFSAWAESRKR